MKIGFIGSGRMAEALMKGFLNADLVSPKDIYASDIDSKRLSVLKDKLKVNLALSNNGIFKDCSIVFLSVKPQQMNEVLQEIKDSATKRHLVISIAAGIKLKHLESKLKEARVVRVMPNTPLMAEEGMSAFCLGTNATKKDKETVEKLLSSAGKVIEIEEELMDAVTATSGSGPAFIAFVINSIARAGVKEGLAEKDAYLLATQTALGTAKLMLENDISANKLIEMVASKRGTTEAGLKVLEKNNVAKAIAEAVEAAAERSRELGK